VAHFLHDDARISSRCSFMWNCQSSERTAIKANDGPGKPI
jgi:hypothetical protein